MDYGRPDLAERLAAGYVLGVLRGRARARFEALLPAHPALRGAVAGWQRRLLPLTGALPQQTPPERVWHRIEATLFGAPAAAARPEGGGWWSGLAFWRGLSALALAAVVGLGVLMSYPAAQAPFVVVLSAADAAPGAPASFVASFSADGRALVTRPLQQVNVQAGRSLELWAVPAEGAPRSLGLVSAERATVLTRGRVSKDTAALAVSLEPAGGSPSGAPTGPIVYSGKLTL